MKQIAKEERETAIAVVKGYTTWGSVRGMGPVRKTLAKADHDLAADQEGCASQRGYSDREVYAIDDEGYVVDTVTGANVYPHGRTSSALKLGRGDACAVPAWMASE